MYRFTYTERLLHWTNTISYLVLALTGLGMFFHPLRSAMSVVLAHLPPLFGQPLRLEQVHILAAIVFVVGPLLWLVVGNRRALWADAREITHFDADDRTWLARVIRFARSPLPPQGRFNAGQKLNALVLILFWSGFLMTGFLLMPWPPFPFGAAAQQLSLHRAIPSGGDWHYGLIQLSRSARQVVIFLHEMFALISITLVAVHIYMATLNPSTRHSLRGMLGGWVRRDWAAAHHAKWVAATDATSSQHCKQPE
jgi:formate dehydrogenase subunit gamma